MFTLSLSDPNFFIFIVICFFALLVMFTLIAGYLFHFLWQKNEEEAAGLTAGAWVIAVFILVMTAIITLSSFHFKP